MASSTSDSMASSADDQPALLDSLLAQLDSMMMTEPPQKKQKKQNNKNATSSAHVPSLEDRARRMLTNGVMQFAENMKHHGVQLTVDKEGLPYFGNEQFNLAVRPPSDSQRIMLNAAHSHYLAVYTQSQVNELKKMGYTELAGLCVPDTSISAAFIAGIPAALAAAATRAETAASSSTGSLPDKDLPETWWVDWYDKNAKVTCDDFIQMWETGAVLTTKHGSVRRQYTLPAPKDNEAAFKAVGRKNWNNGNIAYNNVMKMDTEARKEKLQWSKLRDSNKQMG